MDEATQAAKTEAAKQAVALVFMVLAMVIMAAATNPDFVKTWLMRTAAVSRKLLTSAARQAGHTSMGIELTTGVREYSVPYHLSLLRDKAAIMYEKARNS